MKSLLRITFSFVALACSTLLCSASAWAQQSNAICTNQPGFRIPYRFDQAEMRRLRAKEIRLFLSRNNGFDWQHVQTVAPEAGRFDFKAQTDGEYWFAVRTLDGTNQLHPDANVVEPGLVVIVDRTAPDLQLLLQQSEAGKVQLSWSVSDANLDLSKLSLEFSQAGSNWQPVSVKAQAAGQTSWTVPNGGQVSVRGSVADRAGNVGSAQTSVVVQANDPGGPMRKRPEAADYRNPIAKIVLANTNPRGKYLYSDLNLILVQQMMVAKTGVTLDGMAKEIYTELRITKMGYNPVKWTSEGTIIPTEIDNLFRRDTIQGYVHDEAAAIFGGVSGKRRFCELLQHFGF